MEKYKLKEKNNFFYKIVFIAVISFSIIFVVYFSVDSNRTEYFYDFENDAINSFPAGFVGIGRNTDYTKVVEWNENDGHDGKVVYISYLDRIYLDEVDYSGIELNTLFNKAWAGDISFDIYLVEELGIAIDVCQEDVLWDKKDDICIRIVHESTYVKARDVSGSLVKVLSSPLKLFQWYSFKLKFNCQKHEWRISIYKDMDLIGIPIAFQFDIQPSYLCQLYFATYAEGNQFYIDNVHISLNNLIG